MIPNEQATIRVPLQDSRLVLLRVRRESFITNDCSCRSLAVLSLPRLTKARWKFGRSGQNWHNLDA